MPDEKIDQKRPVNAESEPKPIQQRHVDDTVDDSFPASDPPAWTTSASKSVAAECEPDVASEDQSRSGQTFSLADLPRRSREYLEQGRRYLPEAERYYRQGAQAVSRPVHEHPLATVLAVGALGCALGWLIGRRTTEASPARQWHPGSNRRPQEAHHWEPTPRTMRGSRPFSARNEAEAASHTSNSF